MTPYTRRARLRHAFWFLRTMAEKGPLLFEATKSKFVGPTYGIEPEIIKRIKAKYRCELSTPGEGK